MFRADGRALKAKEIPPRLRRYILMQTEKYRLKAFVITLTVEMGRRLFIFGGEERLEEVSEDEIKARQRRRLENDHCILLVGIYSWQYGKAS